MDALLTVSEVNELNQWFDYVAQNAPEGVQMKDDFDRQIQDEIWERIQDSWDTEQLAKIRNAALRPTDTAASEPAYNPATGWITKPEAEARAEMEAGWQQAEAERVAPSIGDHLEYYKAQLATALRDVRKLEAELKTERAISTASITDLVAAQKENERLQAELKRVNFFYDRDLLAHIDQFSDLVNERPTANHTTENERLQAEIERLQAELARVKDERDRDLMAHIDRVSDLVNENVALKDAHKKAQLLVPLFGHPDFRELVNNRPDSEEIWEVFNTWNWVSK